ncbi:hypothetical protein GCM10010965_04800 [Caldalkalibacillus thermarum]|uniref:GAF domain-containing protein n=1 Tax=Caldalkalibacillus thermarum TaxID=296745 RepID=UPI001668A1CD|nr:GAF domain-containing protein [Caldalkalibacillus thermarum]GGK14870.1 hypothetical protein GCM10010965_04800 [Caldalkalibacillus thermarum]
MSHVDRIDELFTLKTIAETLNQCVDLDEMMPSVLEKLLHLTGLKTGWIFLVKERPHYSCVADHGLPPALEWENKKPMRHMSCWCLDKFWSGQLQQAVNIMECKRLEDAVTYQWGDTHNLTHHATVPLIASGKRFGLLNVGSPGKEHFTEKELTLLQSVAFQIGTAVERIILFEAQKQRAEYFARLDELTRVIWKINNKRVLPEKVVHHIAHYFQWPVIALFLIKNRQLSLKSLYYKQEAGVRTKISHTLSLANAHIIKSALKQQNVTLGQEKLSFLPGVRDKNTWHTAGVPLILSDKPIGLLYLAKTLANPFSEAERDVLKALGDHLSLLIETIRMPAYRSPCGK